MITTTILFLTCLLAILMTIVAGVGGHASSGVDNEIVKCLHEERQALLDFKAMLIDDYGELSSWENGKDCCQWEGVQCDNQTNHVVALDLSTTSGLQGKMISPSLLKLVHLKHLDLSLFSFENQIPEFIGSLGKLRYLNLSYSSFEGMIPHSLGNLSMLQYLDLKRNDNIHSNLDWLSSLQSMKYLDLGYINLSEANTWQQAVNKLPVVKEIRLNYCSLPSPSPTSSIHFVNTSNSLVVLDLSHNQLNLTSIFPWLLNYNSSLSYIDLSYNYRGGGIPSAFTYLRSLSHLDLNSNNLDGPIPNVLWNLTRLSYLDLSNNGIEGSIPSTSGDLMSLSHLDLPENQLQGVFPGQHMNRLTYLDLSHNRLQGDLTNLMIPMWDSTLLEYFDLSMNLFFGSLPNMSLFKHLKELRLNGNHLNGSIQQDNLGLPNLQILDLSTNKFMGSIPDLSSCPNLSEINLDNNMFSGTLTESIGNLINLQRLYLGSNHLQGVITEAHLYNLSNLQLLNLSFNSNLTIRIGPLWNPPFQLKTLNLVYCNVGPQFPMWLQNQRNIQDLSISNANISDSMPDWFWINGQQLQQLDMSHNQIHGAIPDWSSSSGPYWMMDLSSNQFNGTLPPLNAHFVTPFMNMSNNKLSGIESCNFSGYRPLVLDLSNNLLSEHISPDCFKRMLRMHYVDLANNNLHENLESSISNAVDCSVRSLNLRNNNFTGYIPKLLEGCNYLNTLDLGENNFYGNIPEWQGGSMSELMFLSLKSNKLNGSLPSSLCSLSNIQILDISNNMISGPIPNCINNFTVLSSNSTSTYDEFWIRRRHFVDTYPLNFIQRATIMWKGKVAEYINTLWLLKVIDLSNNSLSGKIPGEVTSLVGLLGLNLSRNNLVGSIPRDIGQLELLNFLDLSQNNLTGKIPSTISQLDQLGFLNLSFNNLSGKIPFDNHMDTFTNSSYAGNIGLCGPPLVSKPCPTDREMPKNPNLFDGTHDKEHILKSREFYISMVVGFIVSFWGVFGTLYFNRRWNIAIVKVFVAMEDWLYVKITLNKRRLQTHVQNS